jgi:protein phosphatase/serine/threonine-protein phosphatase Stp1
MTMGFRSHGATDPGTKRRLNEDSYLDRPGVGLWAVADGVGGAAAGEVASAAVCEALAAIRAGLSGDEMLAEVRQRLQAVHQDLLAMAAGRGAGVTIASTVVVLMVAGAHFACLWAGDSRIYLLQEGVLRRLTRDHSLVQAMVDDGTLTEAEAEHHPRANVITRAIGAGEGDLALDKVTGEVLAGDRFLLCSDGLTKAVQEAELAVLLGAPEGASPAELLVAAALAHAARDNVTAVTIEIEAEDG